MQTTIQFKPRVDLEVLVNVVLSEGRSHLGKTGNISPSGMLLEVKEALAIGNRLHLKLFLPGTARKLEMAGEITREDGRHPEGYRYGVRFVGIDPDVEKALEQFLAARLDRHRTGHAGA